jgi:hypothetical protein
MITAPAIVRGLRKFGNPVTTVTVARPPASEEVNKRWGPMTGTAVQPDDEAFSVAHQRRYVAHRSALAEHGQALQRARAKASTFLPHRLHCVTDAWPQTISYDEFSPHVDHRFHARRYFHRGVGLSAFCPERIALSEAELQERINRALPRQFHGVTVESPLSVWRTAKPRSGSRRARQSSAKRSRRLRSRVAFTSVESESASPRNVSVTACGDGGALIVR